MTKIIGQKPVDHSFKIIFSLTTLVTPSISEKFIFNKSFSSNEFFVDLRNNEEHFTFLKQFHFIFRPLFLMSWTLY